MQSSHRTGSPSLPPPAVPARLVTVAVLATDPLTSEGATAYLRACPQLEVVPAAAAGRADVVVMMAATVTEDTMVALRQVAERAEREPRIVLVGDGIREPQLVSAVTCGLVSVLPRRDATFGRIATAILDASQGRGEMPGAAVGWLAAQLRAVQRQLLAPAGLTTGGLQARELDVLQLLADGLDTAEIAGALNYSERTVKNIIHNLLARLNLRNRSHAVAYALRSGLI
jgi:DNA-binding NarL/FixJ family response regulator